MEPADMDNLRQAIEKQGALLGQHQHEFANVSHSFSVIKQSLTTLSEQIQALQPSPPPTPAPTPAPVLPLREPRLPPPPPYAGEPGTCRSFLSQCTIAMELQASMLPTDRSRIAYVIAVLTGRAREWATAVWDANAACCSSFKLFSEEMQRVFDRSLRGKEAARELLYIKQGARSVYDFAIEFRTLAAAVDWNPSALYDAFYNGLNDAVVDQIASLELPDTLEGLIDLTGRVESRRRRREIRRENQTQLSAIPTPTAPPLAAPIPPEPEPMQIGRAKISPEERKRRQEASACYYCGTVGHFSLRCPVRPVKGIAHQ